MTSQYIFDKRVQTKNFEVMVDTEAKYGYFEHETLGDECGGGLWFERLDGGVLALLDYDGVYELPLEVVTALIGLGFVVDQSEDF